MGLTEESARGEVAAAVLHRNYLNVITDLQIKNAAT
jgi:hypothetical protein